MLVSTGDELATRYALVRVVRGALQVAERPSWADVRYDDVTPKWSVLTEPDFGPLREIGTSEHPSDRC